MYRIRAENLKKSALEDIAEMIEREPKDNGEYINHVSNLMIEHTTKYIQEKFSISDKELKKYLKNEKRI